MWTSVFMFIILNSDNLNISSELDVFKAAIRLIDDGIMGRKQQLVRLMKCIRFPFTTHVELLLCNELTSLLEENDECMQMILGEIGLYQHGYVKRGSV